MSLIKLPWIQSAGHYSSRELGLCSFRVSLTDMPRAPPLGELSPQVTERAIEDIQGKKTRNYAEFYFYLPELPDELLAVLP